MIQIKWVVFSGEYLKFSELFKTGIYRMVWGKQCRKNGLTCTAGIYTGCSLWFLGVLYLLYMT